MPGYAAFLRGINLGPRRRVGSADLRSLFEEAGFEDVATFRSSGNVVFSAGREAPANLTARIELRLREALGFEVTTFLRSARELRAITGHQPFDRRQVRESEGKLQVVLLSHKPGPRDQKAILELATGADRLVFGARELYWLPSGGIRDSGLNFKTIERLLGPTTTRTKGTMEELTAKHFGG